MTYRMTSVIQWIAYVAVAIVIAFSYPAFTKTIAVMLGLILFITGLTSKSKGMTSTGVIIFAFFISWKLALLLVVIQLIFFIGGIIEDSIVR